MLGESLRSIRSRKSSISSDQCRRWSVAGECSISSRCSTMRWVRLKAASYSLFPKSWISSAMCARSSGAFGRVLARRRSSFACSGPGVEVGLVELLRRGVSWSDLAAQASRRRSAMRSSTTPVGSCRRRAEHERPQRGKVDGRLFLFARFGEAAYRRLISRRCPRSRSPGAGAARSAGCRRGGSSRPRPGYRSRRSARSNPCCRRPG